MKGSWLREFAGIVLILLLFNVGWGLGLPATHPVDIGSLQFYGQIVFSTANGCIGVVLLVFFCILSEKVRKTCTVRLFLKMSSMNDWQKQSGLYNSSKEDNKDNDKEMLVVKEEEPPVITFEYELNEVYGNPAVMNSEEEYAFESETQFT